MSVTAKAISLSLCSRWSQSVWNPHKVIAAQNVYAIYGEADLLIVQPSGYLYEVEIKISVSDFKREFEKKKEKHECFRLELGKRSTRSNVRDANLIRKFFFAMPLDVYEKVKDQIPPYAGVYGFDPSTMICKLLVPAKTMKAEKACGVRIAKIREAVYHNFWNRQWDDAYELIKATWEERRK